MEAVELDTLLLDVYRQSRSCRAHQGAGALDMRIGHEIGRWCGAVQNGCARVGQFYRQRHQIYTIGRQTTLSLENQKTG